MTCNGYRHDWREKYHFSPVSLADRPPAKQCLYTKEHRSTFYIPPRSNDRFTGEFRIISIHTLSIELIKIILYTHHEIYTAIQWNDYAASWQYVAFINKDHFLYKNSPSLRMVRQDRFLSAQALTAQMRNLYGMRAGRTMVNHRRGPFPYNVINNWP